MALGDITLLEQAAAQGPVFYDRISVVGDSAYGAGGSPGAGGFEALFQAVGQSSGSSKVTTPS